MPDLGNTGVFSQTDASNNSGTMPSWSGAAAPSTLDDAGRAFQGAVTREWNWRSYTLTAAGTADAKTLTFSVAPAAYYNGQRFAFIANTTNTGSATLNVNSLGAKAIKKDVSGTLTNLSASDMVSGKFVEVAYNLANDCFVWVNQSAPQPLGTGDSPQFAGINVGNASDTTITRSAAGVIAVEGGNVPLENRANTFTASQSITGDSTKLLTRASTTAGIVSLEAQASDYTTGFGAAALLRYSSAAASTTAGLSNANLSVLLFQNTSAGLILTNGSAPLVFGTAGSERGRVTQNGGFSFGSSGTAYGTSGQILKSNGDAAPSWITTLPVANGGTNGSATPTNGGVAYGNGTAYAFTSAGTAGQFLQSNGAAAPTWATPGSVLLGTLTTTSGASQSLTSLTLTGYKFLRLVFNGVSGTGAGNTSFGTFQINASVSAGDAYIGIVDVDLGTGIGAANLAATAGASTPRVGSTGYSTATTSVALTISTGTFDAGSVTVYGVP